VLGVRPEHASIGAGGWPLTVDLVEMLGAERLVHGRLGEAPFTLRIEGTAPVPEAGRTVGLQVAPEHVHWFDAGTGRRVAAA
jgi:sn-glycerol 3-phosphate transport system ATP-binding protein